MAALPFPGTDPLEGQDWLRARAAATPTRLALLFQGRALTYGDLDRWADGLAHALAEEGVEPGHRVAVLLPNSPLYVALVHGVARLGGVLVPLNTRWTAQERAGGLARVRPHTVIAPQGPTPEEAAVLAPDRWRTPAGLPGEEDVRGGERWPSFPRSQEPKPPGSRLQALVFTSGTTGEPKAAMLTFANHLWSAVASAFRLGVDPGDRWLSSLPLYHVGGLALVFRSCLYGTALVLHEGFDVDAFRASLDADRITLTSLVPTMLYRLLQGDPRPWPRHLRRVLLGGAAASPELLAAARAARVPVATTYGLTEAASQVATALPEQVQAKPGTVGRPLLFTRVRVVDPGGQDVPPGQVGEIWVRGPQVMQGYWEDPEATAQALARGWLHTGDLGYLDPEGDLWVVQRRKDLIVSGGENVYPTEVEAVLRQHPAVEEACVVGLADPEWGQRVAAMVQVRPHARVDEADLVRFCRQRLAGYKVPRRVRVVAQLPQTASGKIDRGQVAALLEGDGTS